MDALIRAGMDLIRQWPIVRPRGIVTYAPDWVKRRRESISWFARRMAPWYRERYPEEIHVVPSPPADKGEAHVVFYTSRVFFTPACGLFYLDGAYVLSPHGGILSLEGELFDEFSHRWNDYSLRQSDYFSPFATFSLRPKRLRPLAATIAVTGSDNYYHWMFNVLPRLHLLAEVWESIDYFIVSPLVRPFQHESLAKAGVPPERVIELQGRDKYLCERIFIPSIGPHDGAIPQWSISYLRGLFLPVDAPRPTPRRKLYLSRGAGFNRSIANEAEVQRVMLAHGFEVIVPHELTICEQAALCAQASHIVGPHGASFTNMIFGTNVVIGEIFAPEYIVVGFYRTLAFKCGHRYEYFLCGHPPATSRGAVVAHADLGRLAVWLTALLETDGGAAAKGPATRSDAPARGIEK